MRFTTVLASIVAVAVASGKTIKLRTRLAQDESDSYLSSIHEGAGINYVFAGGNGEEYSYDPYQGIIYNEITSGDLTYNLTLSVIDVKSTFPQLQLSVEEPNAQWWFGDDNVLGGLLNGYDVTFYAGKNTLDPYRYSLNSYAIGATGEPITAYDVHQVEGLQVITITGEFI